MNNQELEFLHNYRSEYTRILEDESIFELISQFRDLTLEVKRNGGKLIFAGNGASASIASHCALDYTKQAKVPSITFNDPSVITAFSNDCGYDHWIEQALIGLANPQDLVVLISSSGNSPNVVNGAKYCNQNNIELVTFSGFNGENQLAKLGKINFFLNSSSYNIIESIHMIWLTMTCDLIIGNNQYKPQ